MARRYGRNQKRKHRKRIEFLETLNQTHLKAIDRVCKERDQSEQRAREARAGLVRLVEQIRMICRQSVLLPPEKMPNLDPAYVRTIGYESLAGDDRIGLGSFMDDPRPMTYQRVMHAMADIETVIREDLREPLRKAIHFIVHSPKGRFADTYHVSLNELRHARDLPHVYQNLLDRFLAEVARSRLPL